MEPLIDPFGRRVTDLSRDGSAIIGSCSSSGTNAHPTRWVNGVAQDLAIPIGSHHRPEKATDAFGKKMAEMVMVGGMCGDVFLEQRSAEALLEVAPVPGHRRAHSR